MALTVVGTLGDINENTMTENLSPAPAEGDYSWAEPGVCSWTWLVGGAGMQSNPDQIKKYIDFASEMGWKYFIMDEGWQPRSNQGDGTRYFGEYGWIEDVIKYANEKGVGLIAWVHVDDLNTAENAHSVWTVGQSSASRASRLTSLTARPTNVSS